MAEIETVLTEAPGVLAAAAGVHRPTQQIAAYVIPRSGESIDRDAVRRLLRERLPPYMVPAFLDEVPALPMTLSGKIDRPHLPEPVMALAPSAAGSVAPRTDNERAILEIWTNVLQRGTISVTDNFFLDLDGHSLLAAVAISKLRQRAGFERVSVADLYAHPTIEKLALRIQDSTPSQKRNRHSTAHRQAAISCAPSGKRSVF